MLETDISYDENELWSEMGVGQNLLLSILMG